MHLKNISKKSKTGAVGGALAPEPGTEMQSNGTTQTTAQRHELGCLSATLSVDATSQFMSIDSSATKAQRSTCARRPGRGGATSVAARSRLMAATSSPLNCRRRATKPPSLDSKTRSLPPPSCSFTLRLNTRASSAWQSLPPVCFQHSLFALKASSPDGWDHMGLLPL